MSTRKIGFMRGFGHFLIWADCYRLYFAIHAFFVGPIDVESHIYSYLQVFVPMLDWLIANSPFHRWLLDVLYPLPAAPAYLVMFLLTTSVGMWLVRRSYRGPDLGSRAN